LPRTGIEYPFSKERRNFITNHKEFELLSEYSATPSQLNEYIRNDIEWSSGYNSSHTLVYDCIE
jgi:hypothetical protein